MENGEARKREQNLYTVKEDDAQCLQANGDVVPPEKSRRLQCELKPLGWNDVLYSVNER